MQRQFHDTTGNGKAYERFISALEKNGSRRSGHDFQCPAHDDRTPSLTVNPRPGTGIWVYCHAGCDYRDVVRALGLTPADLFDIPLTTPEQDAARQAVAVLRAKRDAYPWAGRTWRTDRAVLGVLLERAGQNGHLAVSMGVRHISELTGYGHATAANALHRLAALGWLELGPYGDEDAREIFLSVQDETVSTVATSSNLSTYKTKELRLTVQLCTLTRNSDLGALIRDTGIAVYSALTGEPQRVKAIAGAAGVSPSTASRKLHGVLRNLGLTEPDGAGWVIGVRDPATYDPDTDSMSGPVLAPRKARHRKEQEQNRLRIARKRGREENPEPVPVDMQTGERICCHGCCDIPRIAERDGKLLLIRHDQLGIGYEHTPGSVYIGADRGIRTTGKPYSSDRWYCAECAASYNEWEQEVLHDRDNAVRDVQGLSAAAPCP